MSGARAQILIAGCGYVGQKLAARFRHQYDVSAIVRTSDRAAELAQLGIWAVAIDFDRVRARGECG